MYLVNNSGLATLVMASPDDTLVSDERLLPKTLYWVLVLMKSSSNTHIWETIMYVNTFISSLHWGTMLSAFQ